ncbi:phenylalanine--tRNA ligase subunit beta [Segetibacter aerophilus]|uniref:Phenylalanine--tRNA ligase beta subunit n=1 Tax=Segetibacter aerophilus TaxID=670293 RepID=A0A512BF83_9BACT|nr:phenylalanine--tRNA ligase subunit beta [Segetibacter aerophilus]GEO10631.1 phenylalanine--tRNA ligase beta subunit [Segetibacter aerophilus]
MTISYKWLSEYLPNEIDPQELSKILTSIGLEVESLEKFESIKGGLHGVVTGSVLEVSQHPNADKLKLTKVDIGSGSPLKIVCGAANVVAGQKVLVATVGSTIYPTNGQPITIKAAKIRGEESEGMICAEDEIGLGTSHEGVLVLPQEVPVGTKAADYFKPYTDYIFEIGLTPNRMDAMSHLGVARDVCAYLTHHNKQEVKPKSPFVNSFKADSHSLQIAVTIENKEACKRYSGVTISAVTVKESPKWLQDKLLAIGQRPINNIVDITNFILHETGQPLHAFDAAAIKGGTIVVKNLAQNSPFTTLDQKERKLDETDLMICNAEEGMCIAGVFGGAESGVKADTKNIFLESAWFNPITIRKTSFRHGLRTEAAARFEKGVDISNVVNVLKRAALLVKQVAGGEISSDIVDVYPEPQDKTQVGIKYHYLKKLSGKNYHPDAIKRILTSLGFEIVKEGIDELWVLVPYSKPDISLPADLVEEILRIDGLDNVEITGSMTITPAVDENILKENLREKISGYLVGLGFNEIVTNSITNSKYYTEAELGGAAKMINSLSADLDVMRLSMVETGLETIAYNINRKNKDLLLFEFGKTYHSSGVGDYKEKEHLSLYITGSRQQDSWKSKQEAIDFFFAKGIAAGIVRVVGLDTPSLQKKDINGFSLALAKTVNGQQLLTVGEIDPNKLKAFDIKQPVFFIDFDWLLLLKLVSNENITYKEVSKFPAMQRDLAVVVDKTVTFEAVEDVVEKTKIPTLQNLQLFDVFESEKLGKDRKSLAVSFTFLDEEKTLTDKEVDEVMDRLILTFERELSAEIRR